MNGLLRSEGREFVYAVLKGTHYQYYSNYPGGEQDRNLPVQQQYRKALKYSKGEFLETLLDGVDMRGVAIVYTSDHGQNLGSGVIPHCNSEPHPDELSVPLVLLAGPDLLESLKPKATGTRSHSQIFPTTLQWMGYAPSHAMQAYDNPLPAKPKRIVRFGKRIFPSGDAESIEFFVDGRN